MTVSRAHGWFLALAVLAAWGAAGCARGGDDPAAGTQEPAPPASESAAGDGAGALPRAAQPEATFLQHRSTRTMPHDFSIGRLHDRLAGRAAVTETVTRFFVSLAAGTIETRLIAADRRRSLTGALRPHLAAGHLPQALRIGTLAVAGDTAHAAIRLFGQPGRAAGEVYLARTAQGWRIADLQIDLQQLGVPYAAAEREFRPRRDRWILVR